MKKLAALLLLFSGFALATNSYVQIPKSGGSATVTSVAVTVPAEFSVSGSPVTTSGTIAITRAAVVSVSGTNIDWSLGSMFDKAIITNTTMTFSNVGAAQCIIVNVKDSNTSTMTWPTATVGWSGATSFGSGQPTQTTSGFDMWTFCAHDATHIIGQVTPNAPALY